MNWPLFFAFLSPVMWALMNVIDTYIVKRKVKHVLSFAVVSGIINIFLGVVLVLSLNWSGYSLFDLRFSVLAGLMLGIQIYFYYGMLAKYDVSHVVGLIYIYPLIVAFLSYLFLNEQLSLFGYFGGFLTIMGIFLMSVRLHKLKMNILGWSILMLAITSALNEFFIKLATVQLPVWNGTAINSIIIGLCILPALFNYKIRKDFPKELKNIPITLVSELLTLGAIATLYLAMTGLPATIVSVISATQPLFVLIFEGFAFFFGIKIVKDINWKHKIFAVALVVIGIVILYGSEIV